jgi:hypothetical protein
MNIIQHTDAIRIKIVEYSLYTIQNELVDSDIFYDSGIDTLFTAAIRESRGIPKRRRN